MSTRHDIAELSAKLEQLLDMLDQLEKQENRKAALFANGVRHRLAELRRIGSDGNDMRLAMRLLDIVPSAKDLDAIDFPLDRHPAIDVLRSSIEALGARVSKSLTDVL